jgi:hypothetical protein
MAIQVQTVGATDLRLAADIIKPNYTAGRSIGGQAGQIMGHWRAMMVRVPASGFTANAGYVMLGRDGAGNGNFNGGEDTVLRIGGDNVSQAASRLRPIARYRASATDAFAGTSGAEGAATSIPQLALAPGVHLIVEGISNTGTAGSPNWRGWAAACQIGSGTPASHVAATAISATWLAATSGALLRQIFAAAASGVTRTPVGVTIEQVALVQGDFPWDTANNRPHHDAVAALAGVGGNPFLTYAGLVAAQNAGTLPYANCDQGLGNLDYWWTLRDLSAGLTNSGSAGAASFTQTDWNSLSGGLVNAADIAPAHWYSVGGVVNPTIADQAIKFVGGRGTRALVVSGTRDASQNVERRWEVMATGNALPGFDWEAADVQSGTTWQTTDTLPIGGPYRLRARYAALPDQAAVNEDWLVGTVMVMHGQSGMELVFDGGVPANNNLNIAVASGAQGILLKLANQDGGSSSTYARPTLAVNRLRAGQTPANNHGAVLFLNEWNVHNPGHPILICNQAINGTAMADWAENTTVNGGHASWGFLGTIGAVAGASSGNNSGVVESYAAALGRYTDVHIMMWTPGMSGTAGVDDTTAGSRLKYRRAIDDRFSAAASAPFVVLPPWRGHREPPDSSSTTSKRQEHLDFVAQLGARGVLGPYWPDVVSDSNGSLHSAFNSAPGVPSATLPVSDGNQVGQARLGRGLGRVAAWHFDRTIKAHGPRVLAAWFTDAGRMSIQVELGRKVRTLNGAAIANRFWISTDNGTNFTNTGFTVALDASGTRAVLTSTGAAFPASNCRVDYAPNWPFGPTETPDEASTERLLDGLLYDDQTHRGGTNFAAGVRPGNPLSGTNRIGTGLAGVPVAARGAAKLVATERWTGSRNVTVRMTATDAATGLPVEIEKTIAVTGAAA